MPKLVLDLNDRRPAWSLPPWVAQEVREALPDDWELHLMETEADGSGDGMTNLSPTLLDAARDAEIYMGYGVPAALIRESSALRWVHSGAAGVRGSLTPEMLSSPVKFTNSKGVHGPPIADTVLGMILHFARGLDFGVASKAEGRWNQDPYYRADHPLVEMADVTVGIFGFGGIGREVARRVGALGSSILAFDLPSGAEEEGGPEGLVGGSFAPPLPDLPRLERLWGPEEFERLLRESDFLVLTAPETEDSRGVIGEEAFRQIKPGAVLVNVSRGRLIQERPLLAALREGRLRGFGLDVYETEPIPEGHPLWTLPNVMITPHVAGVSRRFWRRQTDLIVENIRRYLAGEDLLNLVNKEAGF